MEKTSQEHSVRKPEKFILDATTGHETYRANWSWTKHTENWLRSNSIGRILNIPCGKSKIGLRCDVDRKVKPDVIADLYHLPFNKYSFDTVICDPPFSFYGKGKKWFWVKLADIARHRLILSTPLRRIEGIKGKKSIFLCAIALIICECSKFLTSIDLDLKNHKGVLLNG